MTALDALLARADDRGQFTTFEDADVLINDLAAAVRSLRSVLAAEQETPRGALVGYVRCSTGDFNPVTRTYHGPVYAAPEVLPHEP